MKGREGETERERERERERLREMSLLTTSSTRPKISVKLMHLI